MSQDLDQQVRQALADYCRRLPRRHPLITGALGLIILVLIIWFLPHWQVPVSGLSIKDRLHQINENRKTVAQIVGGVFILVGLYIAWVRSKALRDQAEVDREQQLTDLNVKAIEQLGSEKLQIRLGGIYALERIARESPKDHWPIMEVLTAFVRENAPLRDETPTLEASQKAAPTPEKPPTDIQAVLTVLGRRARTYGQGEEHPLDLRDTHLTGANLFRANLQGAIFKRANLKEAIFINASLQNADLSESNLHFAQLNGANFQGSYFNKANLKETNFYEGNLQLANFYGANLMHAKLIKANLQNACLIEANLKGTLLMEAHGLTPDRVAAAYWDETTKWPEDFSPPPPRPEKEEEKE